MRACRLCLTKKDLTPLFGDLSAVRFSSKQLFVTTGVQIRRNDGFPQFACLSCINLIKSSLHLRFISTQANLNLKQILQKSSTKNELNDNDVYNDDYTNDFYDYSNDNYDITFKTEDVESNTDNSEQCNTNEHQNDDLNIVIEVPIINGNDYKSTDTNIKKKIKRTLRKKNKIHKSISIDDLESSDSNCNNFSNVDNIKIEDFESDSEIEVNFKIDRSLDRELWMCDILNNKNNSNYSFIKKHKAIINENQKNKQKRDESLSNEKANENLNNECNKKYNDSNKNSNEISNNKLKISDKCTKISKLPIINLNNRIYYNLTHLDNYFVKNAIKKKIDNEFNRTNMKRSEAEEKKRMHYFVNKPRCKKEHEKYYAMAGIVKGDFVKCKGCKKYIKRGGFLSHAKQHYEPEFPCEHCGKGFHFKAQLIYHQQRLHGLPKRLTCDKCDYQSVFGDDLINHKRISHSGEKPFICDLCNSSFPLRRNIVQHMRTHFGVKYVQCDRCPKMFKCKSHLWSHQHKVHFDNYNYHCYLCPETYKSVKPVKKHLLNVHGIPEDQQLKIKYVRTKRITPGVPHSSADTVIPSRNYFKNIELNSN